MRKKIIQKPELDYTNNKILRKLQDNCRLSYKKLGDKLCISSVIVASRIKNLENSGILKGYTVILDPVKLGFDLTALVFIKTEGMYLKDLEIELSQMTNVVALYEITGDFDVVAIVKLKDRDGLNNLLKNLLVTPHIKKTMTDITLNVVKEEFRIKL